MRLNSMLRGFGCLVATMIMSARLRHHRGEQQSQVQ